MTDRPSDKLDKPLAGPYEILKNVGHSHQLKLPENFKIHDKISPDKLRRGPDHPLPGQINDPEPPEEVNGEQEYEVEQVIASRISRGNLQYQISWKN